ncbi:MAG TPA: HepT-like ribonuclease domain-containing protein [Polyangiaceae bacterium]|nr:HepT-like ribonuclease domain-containing protein [Polyangiaceae bacterium]
MPSAEVAAQLRALGERFGIRNIRVFGSVARRLCARAIRLRDRLIHDYFRVDLNIAWDVVTHDLAPLRDALTALLDGA